MTGKRLFAKLQLYACVGHQELLCTGRGEAPARYSPYPTEHVQSAAPVENAELRTSARQVNRARQQPQPSPREASASQVRCPLLKSLVSALEKGRARSRPHAARVRVPHFFCQAPGRCAALRCRRRTRPLRTCAPATQPCLAATSSPQVCGGAAYHLWWAVRATSK